MNEISAKGLVKAFEEDKNILDGLSFDIAAGERVGLLGANGAGKTTLLRLLTGEIFPDEGEISIASGKRLGLISQIPSYPEGYTARMVLESAHERFRIMSARIQELESKMTSEATSAVMCEYDRLRADFERQGGYEADVSFSVVANGLNIPAQMLERPFAALSGGEKTRVNLARLILEDTDILLLDEPTNHLDMRSVEWLEEYLLKFKGTVLAVSHDRYFLDRIVVRVIEIVSGRAQFYSGGYSFYVKEKKRRFDEQMAKYEKEQAIAGRLRESADRLAAWGTGNKRLMRKSQAIESRIARTMRTDKPKTDKALRTRFEEREFFGDEVLIIKDLSKSFGGRMLFSGVDLELTAGERVALIGDNGTGKTTLIKLMQGSLVPDSGFIRFGPAVRAAYLPQIISFEHEERTVLDTVLYEKNCSPQTARNMLGTFKFRGEDVFRPTRALSGGERSRLKLMMLMADEISLLILDEPTNHLDIQSREWIEEAVADFEGALILVSHDRYFINRLVTRIWEIDNGELYDFYGSFEEYSHYKEKRVKLLSTSKTDRIDKNDAKRRENKKKLSPEKIAAKAERDIKNMEELIKNLDERCAEYASDYKKLMELEAERELAEAQLLELYRIWEESIN